MKCRGVPFSFFFLGLLTLLARPTSVPKAFGAATPTHRMPFEAPVVVASGKALNLLRVTTYMTSGRYEVNLFQQVVTFQQSWERRALNYIKGKSSCVA